MMRRKGAPDGRELSARDSYRFGDRKTGNERRIEIVSAKHWNVLLKEKGHEGGTKRDKPPEEGSSGAEQARL